MTLKHLKKQWWWKRKEIRRHGPENVGWQDVEIAARNYELMRRAPNAKEFTKTYLELNRDERTFIHCLWCNWQANAYRFAMNPRQFDEVGWTPVYENQRTQWNLNAPDSALKEAFMREINVAREIQGIKAPKPLKGRKNRGVSWRYIEMLDRTNCGLAASHSPSARKAASEGRKMAARFLRDFKRALAKSSPRELHPFEINDSGVLEFFNLKLFNA